MLFAASIAQFQWAYIIVIKKKIIAHKVVSLTLQSDVFQMIYFLTISFVFWENYWCVIFPRKLQ